jgi:ElaB/YqjD/DUF883 family membrane-anchored ribosome-binding protein
MGKSSDEIRQEIDEQRADAGQKIDHLEHQIQGNVEHARDQVMDTADQVRGEAKALVNDTVDTVKENFDLHQQIQERPLVSAGAALVGGFLLGSMMSGDDHHRQTSGYRAGGETTGGGQHTGGHHNGGGLTSGIRSAAEKSGLDETVSNAAAALMGSVTEQLKHMLDQSFPGFSEKLDTAQHKSGSFTDKAKATQQEVQQA